MSRIELKGIGSFKWASAAAYQTYIANVAGLQEISSVQVYSFPLVALGVDKLIARKVRLLTVIMGNMQSLDTFVNENVGDLKETELVYIRSLYGQLMKYKGFVEQHLAAARSIQKTMQLPLEDEDESEDEIPF